MGAGSGSTEPDPALADNLSQGSLRTTLTRGLFVKALDIPRAYLSTAIMAICVIGVYSTNLSAFDVAMTAVFGLGSLTLAFVLGLTFERSLRQTLLITDGDLVASLTGSPIALALVALGILLLASGLFGINRRLPAED